MYSEYFGNAIDYFSNQLSVGLSKRKLEDFLQQTSAENQSIQAKMCSVNFGWANRVSH